MLTIGDIVPPVALATADGGKLDLLADDIAGNYTILVLCGDVADDRAAAEIERFRTAGDTVTAAGGRLFLIVPPAPGDAGPLLRRLSLPFPAVTDQAGALFEAFGAEGAAVTTVVLRPNNHVMAVIDGGAADHPAATLEVIRADEENRRMRPAMRHPPVLIVPDVLSRKDCQHLISIFNFEGNVWVEPGHGTQNMTGDYKMRIPDYGREDRIDHWIISEKTTDFVTDRLRARLFPEIAKAFQYEITRFERYRIGSYKGERHGEAHGHRDNSDDMVAHRRFAASINLNSEQFDGGELRFPEYGGQVYRPETGAAIVFSSSILHEALPVTKGQRFVLLSFLFGDR